MGIGSAGKAAKSAQEAQIQMQTKAAEEAKVAREQAAAKAQSALDKYVLPTYLETPEAQTYKQTLEDRMAGRGLIDVNAQTSPIANQVRAGLEKTNASIGSAASARGLGRSTVATSQIGEASQAAERDIAERMSQLELTRQAQIENAVNQYGGLTETEYGSQANKANFQRSGEFTVSSILSGNADANMDAQFAIADAIAKRGQTEAAYRVKNAEQWESYIKDALGLVIAAGTAGATGGTSVGGTKITGQGSVANVSSSDLMDYRNYRNGALVLK